MRIDIEVVYALPSKQRLISLQVEEGTTAREAVLQAGLAEEFPDLRLTDCPLGVFGQVRSDAYCLKAGDRVELYRPLMRDPRDVRRQLAARGATMGSRERWDKK